MPIPQGVRGLLVPLDCAEEGPRERRRETREGERVLLPGTYLSSDFGAHAVERPPTPAGNARETQLAQRAESHILYVLWVWSRIKGGFGGQAQKKLERERERAFLPWLAGRRVLVSYHQSFGSLEGSYR